MSATNENLTKQTQLFDYTDMYVTVAAVNPFQ